MQITTFLMFSGERYGKAEEAVRFYVSLFPDSHVDTIERYGPEGATTEGTVKFAGFTLGGQKFKAIDSVGPHDFNFTPSMSLFVECTSEEEISRLFAALAEGGEILMPLDDYGFSRCFGWTNDRYGVSWQLNLP